MATAISSQSEFNSRVHGSRGGMMLLFHGNNPDQATLDGYEEQANDKCGSNYPVYTINIDIVHLTSSDITKYQLGINTITCTLLNSDNVFFKQTSPDNLEVWNAVQC